MGVREEENNLKDVDYSNPLPFPRVFFISGNHNTLKLMKEQQLFFSRTWQDYSRQDGHDRSNPRVDYPEMFRNSRQFARNGV